MAAIKLRIHVSELANVMTLFDEIKVYRSTAGISGTYTEITGLGTRITLVALQTVYEYDDIAGDPAYYYKTSYFNSVSSAESSLSEAIKGEGTGNYVSIQDFRDEGVTVAQASDERLLALIEIWESFVNEQTGQWFYPKDITLELDGNDTDILFLSIPIISVTSLKLNGETEALDAASYVVYNRFDPDDRRNPRIKLQRTSTMDLFERLSAGGSQALRFAKGYRNQIIEGSFGFIEPDGCAPKLIKYAVTRLVIARIGPEASAGASPAGPVVEEWTDGHKLKYSDIPAASGGGSITGDLEVDRILKMYRRPIGIASPRGWGEPVVMS